MCKPLTANAEESASFPLTFLHQATEIFKQWKASGQSGLSQIGFSPDFQSWIQLATCFRENLSAIQFKDVLAGTARPMVVIFVCQFCNFFNQKKNLLPKPAATKSSPHFS